MFSALLAVAVLASTSPDSRLASLQITAAFHLYVMPDSSVAKQVTVLASDPTGKATAVRIIYELSQQTLVVVETAVTGDGGAAESYGPNALYVDGYPATYSRTGPYYRKEGHLTWLPPGVRVELSSTDLWDVPGLVNSALAMR